MSLPDDKWLLAFLFLVAWNGLIHVFIALAFHRIRELGEWMIRKSETRDIEYTLSLITTKSMIRKSETRDIEIRRLQDKVDELENHLFGE